MKKFDINNRRYLGSKAKFVDFIKSTVYENCDEVESVIDIFSGTGVVGNSFAQDGKKVYVNDILKSNYYSYNAWFGKENIDLVLIDEIVEKYNKLDVIEDNYFSINFANTYFSKGDCRKIGYIRENINKLYEDKKINKRERDILITSLLYSMDRIANTVGHYDAYRKKNDMEDKFIMYSLNCEEKEIKNVEIFNKNSNELIEELNADLVYIDPPYNSRQYSDAYHLLENVACWEKPKVYGVAKKMDRSNLKSEYCTNKAVSAFEDLINKCNTKYILVSYNNTGDKSNGRSNAKISDLQIQEILAKKGEVKIFEKSCNNFSAGKSKSIDHKERLFLCSVGKKESKIVVKEKNKYAKSPLNYTGGKYKLLPQLESKFPDEIHTFVDFFCGGANVACNMNAKQILAVDNQTSLIRILNLLKNNKSTDIINKIDEIIEKYNLSNTYKNGYEFYGCESSSGLGKYNKAKYEMLRKDYNMMPNSEERDYLFLTLIIYAFNNQIRFNNKGEYNMPVGKRDFNSSIRAHIYEFCEKIISKNLEFIDSDFEKFDLDKLNNDDFCYFDPPYFLGDATYNENNGWNSEKEKRLLQYINKVSEKNIKFALSNVVEHKGEKNDILINWALENHYNINYLNFDYKNSNYHLNDKNCLTKEVLITNY